MSGRPFIQVKRPLDSRTRAKALNFVLTATFTFDSTAAHALKVKAVLVSK